MESGQQSRGMRINRLKLHEKAHLSYLNIVLKMFCIYMQSLKLTYFAITTV